MHHHVDICEIWAERPLCYFCYCYSQFCYIEKFVMLLGLICKCMLPEFARNFQNLHTHCMVETFLATCKSCLCLLYIVYFRNYYIKVAVARFYYLQLEVNF